MGVVPRVEGDTAVHTAILDWDGTLVPAQWPERPTTWMPGAVANVRRLHAAGIKLVVFSARLSPWDPFTSQRRDPGHVASEIQYVRAMLDNAGLTFVDIWTKEGKPGGSVYVDDKAERYGGNKRSWDIVTDKILARLGKEDALFPAFRQSASDEEVQA
jgi:hypothetical protein